MSPPARRGVIAKALLGVGVLATLGLGALQAAGTDFAPRAPESIWPTTVSGWFTLCLAAAAAWGIWRKRESENVAPLRKEITDAVQHFKSEIARVERDTIRHVDGSLAGVQQKITADVNGWGRRIEVVERSQEAQDGFNDSVVRFMGQSETDRANLGRRLDEIGRDLATIRDAVLRRQ